MDSGKDSRCGASNSDAPTSRLSSTSNARDCGSCATPGVDPLGYCIACGHRSVPTSSRSDLVLPCLGAVTDIGQYHRYNQDAVAIGADDTHAVAVICDGISQSTFGELAAIRAAETGVDRILAALSHGEAGDTASRLAVAAAAQTAAHVGIGIDVDPPGCTYTSVVIDHETVIVTSVGDSRAYWLSGDHAECLTIDDTPAGYLAAHQVPFDDERYYDRHANALLRWLGADAPDLDVKVAVHRPDRSGLVVLCSDGLSGYTDQPADLLPIPHGPPIAIASALTDRALRYGGRDNISVAVAPFPKPTAPPHGTR